MELVEQVERSNDDVVKLKILQTALTLLQSPSAFDNQVCLEHSGTSGLHSVRNAKYVSQVWSDGVSLSGMRSSLLLCL
jgi:hypothetical protein